MRSTHPEDQRGPRPAWNGIGFGLVAVAVALFVVFTPEQRVTEAPPAPTISLDDLEAMLTDSPGEPPPRIEVETPDGPVTVIVPTTSTTTTTAPPRRTTTTTTTTAPPPTTTVQHGRPRDPATVMQDFIDDLGAAVPTTTEVVDE